MIGASDHVAGDALVRDGHTEVVDVFFDDLDAFGMVYHGRFAALLEHAITVMFARSGLSVGHPDLTVVVRELQIVFERPVTKAGPVEVTLRVEQLGRTSAVFAFRFHSGEMTYAHGRRVVVKIDPRTVAPEPWTDSTRDLLRRTFLDAR
ncbi:acyl-CoA thioesterase [Streptomyces sp. NPDC005498]|uniref:acyl-CoA thioesterase n=1 Tax=Streptomyces sp. NPDC005498 TaxID=3364717 RepID=UPI0036C5C81B